MARACILQRGLAVQVLRTRVQVESLVAVVDRGVFFVVDRLGHNHIDPADGGVAGMVEHTPIETVIARLGEWEIVWMPATEAASQRWSNLAAHKELAVKLQSVLSNLQSGIAASLESTEISEGIPRKTLPPFGVGTPGGPL